MIEEVQVMVGRVLWLVGLICAVSAISQDGDTLFHDSFEKGVDAWRAQGEGFEISAIASDFDENKMLRLDNSKGVKRAFAGVGAGPLDAALMMSFMAKCVTPDRSRVGIHRYGGPIAWRDIGPDWQRVSGSLRSHEEVAHWYVVVPAGAVLCVDDVQLTPLSLTPEEKAAALRRHREASEARALAAYDALDCVLPQAGTPWSPTETFPIGFYMTRTTADRNLSLRAIFEELADAGVNVLHNSDFEDWPEHTDRYDEINSNPVARRYLRQAQDAGIGVLMGFDRMMVKRGETAGIADRVRALRSEPGLYGWYLMDEPTVHGVSPETLARGYQAVKRIDSEHPVINTICRPERVKDYADATDIVLVDTYPVSVESLFNVAVPVETALVAVEGLRPVWAAIQVLNIDLHRIRRGGEISHLIRDPRGPSVEEVRCMTYLAIAHGASGILFFAYDGVFMGRVYNDPAHYEGVLALVREIVGLSELLCGDCLSKGTVRGRDRTRVSYIVRGDADGPQVLIAVNGFDRPSGPVSLPMPDGSREEVVLEAHGVVVRKR